LRWTGCTAAVHGNERPRSTLSKTDGRDRSVHDRLTGEGDDDVSDDVTTGGGGSAARTARTAHARQRTAALRHEWKAPTDRGRRGELTGDQNHGGRATDGAGDEGEAAATFGSMAATALRRSSAVVKRWRQRRRPCEPDGGDGDRRRRLQRRRDAAEPTATTAATRATRRRR
jgi:hypothetical protein